MLLGSVNGLNLRNLAWHGFFSAKDVKPEFAGILIVCYYACFVAVQEKGYKIVPQSFPDYRHVSTSLA